MLASALLHPVGTAKLTPAVGAVTSFVPDGNVALGELDADDELEVSLDDELLELEPEDSLDEALDVEEDEEVDESDEGELLELDDVELLELSFFADPVSVPQALRPVASATLATAIFNDFIFPSTVSALPEP